MSVIAIDDLRFSVRPHFWSRRRAILKGASLTVEAGEIFGFLGPNGAGKTTTLKALLGLITPDAGRATIFGKPAGEPRVRRRLGFMPERAYFPEHLTAAELLFAHALLAGLDRTTARHRVDEVLAQVGLTHARDERLRGFSKGMQQRVGLGQALIGEPELVVLDEPMSGLDPMGRHDVRQLMLELRARGKTVFFSTHILPDVETICDRVAILVGGVVRRIERLDTLLADSTAGVEVVAEAVSEAALAELRALAAAVVARGASYVLTARSLDDANRLIDRLRAHGARIVSVQTHRRTLEQVFVDELRAGTKEAA